MRMVSLMVTLLVMAWLIVSLMGKDKGGSDPQAYQQMEQRASSVQEQVDEQMARQAKQLSEINPDSQPEQQ